MGAEPGWGWMTRYSSISVPFSFGGAKRWIYAFWKRGVNVKTSKTSHSVECDSVTFLSGESGFSSCVAEVTFNRREGKNSMMNPFHDLALAYINAMYFLGQYICTNDRMSGTLCCAANPRSSAWCFDDVKLWWGYYVIVLFYF